MSGASLQWLDRVAESLREHEDRAKALQNGPPRYEILGEVSRGGMGIVYLAWDPPLGRNVALKVLKSEGGSPGAEAHERFQREAKLAGNLHHPNIVQVYDSNTWNGQDYIAMQYIEGATLDQAKLERRQMLACIRDAARALHFAHEQGIVHRDIKPGNLLVDKGGRVYVTDFGVARQAVVSASLTSPGTVVGTPTYMSPEQAQGAAVDGRSDVYSLGATLYEMVAGRPPFPGKDAVEVLDAVRTKEPEPPCKVTPDLSKNVEAIILGAMERRREDRYASAASFADDIDRYLNGERPLRRSRGITYRFRREFVRHPWRSSAAVVLGVLLLAAGVVLGYVLRAYIHWQKAGQTTDRDRKMQELRIAGTVFPKALEEYGRLSAEKASELAEARRLADEEKQRKQTAAILAQNEAIRQQLIEQKERQDQKDRDDKILALVTTAQRFLISRDVVAARPEIEGLKSLAPEKYQELLPQLRTLEFEVGVQELTTLAAKTDVAGFERAYKALESFKSRPDFKSNVAPHVFRLAINLGKKQSKDAIPWFNVAEGLGIGDPQLYELRGLALIGLERWEEAQRDFQELVGRTPPETKPHREFAVLPLQKGQRAAAQKDWAEAIKNFAIAVWIDPNLAKAFHDRGLARFRSNGQARKALEEELKIALEKDPKLVPDPEYRDVVLSFARSQVAQYWKSEEGKERETAWRDALGWLTRLMQGRLSTDPDLLLERSRMHRRLGDLSSALADALRADEARTAVETKLNLGTLMYLQGHSEKNDQRMADAIEHLDRAELIAPADPRVPYWRGLCRSSLKDYEGALKDFLKSSDLGLRYAHLHLKTSDVRLYMILQKKKETNWKSAFEEAAQALTGAELLSEDEYVAALHELRRTGRAQAIRLLTRDAYLFKGQALNRGHEYLKSIDECTAAIQIDPQYSTAYLWRGYSRCEGKVDHKAAQEDFRQTLRFTTYSNEKDLTTTLLNSCNNKH